MPIDPAPYARPASSEPACRAVVAARLHAPESEAPLLRRLRVRGMLGGLLDDPELLAAAAADVGLDAQELDRWCASERRRESAAGRHRRGARRRRARRARSTTSSAARATSAATPHRATSSHATTGARCRSRASTPSRPTRPRSRTSRPSCERRPKPSSVEKLLDWAAEPLATAEVALVMQLDYDAALEGLERVAQPHCRGRRLLLDALARVLVELRQVVRSQRARRHVS